MNPKPTVGRIVHFYLNEDMMVSPAVVLNTHATTDAEFLSEEEPEVSEGSWRFDHEQGRMVLAGGEIVKPLASDDLDLLVHGLVRDYRAYSVPHSTEPRAGHWSWPPRV